MTSPANTSHGSLSHTGQLAFLNLIAHDDGFRAQVEADPAAKLAEYGLHVDPADLPAVVRLPPKQAVQDGGLMSDSLLDMVQKWFGFLSA